MKRNLTRAAVTLIFFSFAVSLSAQHTVSGKVIDEETNQSVPGATIIEKGTTNGTISDVEGNYKITVSDINDILIVSYIGYETLEITIDGRSQINLILSPDIKELDEVVVIGYGTQKKKVVTGAIATVNAKEIEKIPVLRAEQAMQGRTAGVQVTQLSGQPGEAPTVRIRGLGTTGDADPLYIIDGLPVESIDYLNPGDIASIDVLKDAASAAIYGTRAANGVVLITTKKGTPGQMQVSYSTYYGIQNPAKKIDMLDADQYRMMMNEGARNAGLTEPFDLNEVPKHNTNWQDLMFEKNAPIMNHNLSVAGGNNVSTYASSFSYFTQEGIIGGEKSQFDRITARLNTSHQVTDRFRFGNNLAYSHIVRRGIGSNESFNGVYSSALNMDPLTALYEDDPDVLSQPPYSGEPVVEDENGNIFAISNYVGAEVVNPLALLEIQNGETRVDRIVGNLYGELELIEGLIFRTSIGVDLSYVNYDSYTDLFYLNGAQNNVKKTSVYKRMDRYFNWQWENTLRYEKEINYHKFSVLAGTSAKEDNWEDLDGFNAKVPTFDPDNIYLNMATDTAWVATGGAVHSSLFSVFGRITYDYKSRYAFTGIIRRDGSSKFGANNRYGTFPSVGVSWLITEEPWMPSLKPVGFVKLRASWGVNGNQEIGNYQYVSLIDKSRGYIFGSGRLTGASPAYLENADIHWEEAEQIDIGLDMGVFGNRLTASFDYYVKNTKGLLEVIPIPAHVGNDPPVANVGSVRNKGIEISLNWRENKKEFRYSVGANVAFNQNEMTLIGNDEGEIPGATWAIAGFVTNTEIGLPIAYFWGYETDGLFQNEEEVFNHIGPDGSLLQPNAKPGDVRFVDINNDGKIGEEDRTMIGNPTPDWTLGVNASFEYMNFDFSFLMVGAFGHEIFNGSQRQDLRYTNRTTKILDRWTGEGTSDEIPRYTWSDINNNYQVSDLYIEDGSYVRLKNIQIGYSIPTNILSKIKASRWRFYISAENLFTITNYTGADPEIGQRGPFDIGIDRGIYPQARTFRFGTSITF
ncbi:MAG: TonB-dependent receptor [Bacteroidota bacterium]|nr:TonB-dependent receptor [Bacteroidota bacterium]